jgi:hypothetical protein
LSPTLVVRSGLLSTLYFGGRLFGSCFGHQTPRVFTRVAAAMLGIMASHSPAQADWMDAVMHGRRRTVADVGKMIVHRVD